MKDYAMNTDRKEITTEHLMKVVDFDKINTDNLSDIELEYVKELLNSVDNQLTEYSNWVSSKEAKELFTENIEYAKEAFDNIDLTEILEDTRLSANEIIERIYDKGLKSGYSDIKRRYVFTDSCRNALKIVQGYNFDRIVNVSDDLRGSVKSKIFQGLAAGESIPTIARNIRDAGIEPIEGRHLSAYQRSVMIARTETGRAMVTGKLQSYSEYGVEKVEVVTARDSHVCAICLQAAYEFNEGDKVIIENAGKSIVRSIGDTGNLPLFHPNCRCAVVAVLDHYTPPEKPVDDTDVIDLTQDFRDISSNKEELEYRELKREQIPDSIPEILANHMLKFDAETKGEDVEYLTLINLTRGAVSSIITNNKSNKVNAMKLKDFVFNPGDSYSSIHNHHTSNDPFNHVDAMRMFDNVMYNPEYMIVHTPEFVYIAKFKVPLGELAKDNIIEHLEKDFGKGYISASEEGKNPSNVIWNTYINDKVLTNNIDFMRIIK